MRQLDGSDLNYYCHPPHLISDSVCALVGQEDSVPGLLLLLLLLLPLSAATGGGSSQPAVASIFERHARHARRGKIGKGPMSLSPCRCPPYLLSLPTSALSACPILSLSCSYRAHSALSTCCTHPALSSGARAGARGGAWRAGLRAAGGGGRDWGPGGRAAARGGGRARGRGLAGGASALSALSALFALSALSALSAHPAICTHDPPTR